MLTNFSRHPLNPQSTEYKFVADKFNKSWGNGNNLPPFGPPPPPVLSMSTAPLPPPNNVPVNPFGPLVFPQIGPMPAPAHNNNITGPTMNPPMPPLQPPPSLAHMLGPIMHRYPLPPGILSTASLPVQPPPLPPPPPPPQPHRAGIVHRRVRRPLPFPVNNPTGATNPMGTMPQIIQIERVQNQRWYKQYSAHECEFRQKLGKQTEQWLFHGKSCLSVCMWVTFILLLS